MTVSNRLRRVYSAVSDMDAGALADLGIELADAGEDELAERVLRLAASDGEPSAAHNLGLLLAGQGRYQEAATAYRDALSLAELTDTAVNLAVLLSDHLGEPDAAVEILEPIAAADSDARMNLALTYLQLGRDDAAEPLLADLAREGDAQAAGRLALYAMDHRDFEKAIKLFRRQEALGDVVSGRLGVAWALENLGKIEAAESAIRSVIAAEGAGAGQLVELLRNQGRNEEALSVAETAVEAGQFDLVCTLIALAEEAGAADDELARLRRLQTVFGDYTPDSAHRLQA